MPQPNDAYTTNTLLNALSADDLILLKPHLTRVELPREHVMVVAHEPVEHVYFPESGVASIVSYTDEAGATEVGIFGREGFSGMALLLGADRSPHRTFMQVPGVSGLRMDAHRFVELVDRSASSRRMLLRYVQTFLVQTAQSAVANAHFRIESRLARWILMCHDRWNGDDIPLTHEFMSMMIAAQRSGVTVTLHILEGSGLIKSKRGRVIVIDRERLEGVAGEGYGQPEAEYRRLIGPLGHPRTGD